MSELRDLQALFRSALLDDSPSAFAHLFSEGGLSPDERLGVYRNNVFSSLLDVLMDTFPVVCRLVDERFFAYAVHEFVRSRPPRVACLHEYGEQFPDFLGQFPPCLALVYLSDVARLEWFMHRAAFAPEASVLALSTLSGLQEWDISLLTFDFHPAVRNLSSPWPVDRIWRANRPGSDGTETIDLMRGGVSIEVARVDAAVVFRVLDAANFAFRNALAAGEQLGEAAAHALALDKTFDLAAAFGGLFHDGILLSFSLTASQCTETNL